MGLIKPDRLLINSLNPENVQKTLAGLNQYIRTAQWVDGMNRYSTETVERLRADFDKNTGRLSNPSDLAQFIAASALLHCADGWSYLGKAVLSLLRGDPHGTRHLAYYAELRAAMSLLAVHGVGIFEDQHFGIKKPNDVVPFTREIRTHRATWKYLKHWSTNSRSSQLFATVVQPYGRKLEDWFFPIGGTQVVSPQARSWFSQWGMDLRIFSDDLREMNRVTGPMASQVSGLSKAIVPFPLPATYGGHSSLNRDHYLTK